MPSVGLLEQMIVLELSVTDIRKQHLKILQWIHITVGVLLTYKHENISVLKIKKRGGVGGEGGSNIQWIFMWRWASN